MLDLTFLNSITRDHFIPTLQNLLYNQMVVFNLFHGAGRVQDMKATSLSWRVVAKRHSARGVYSGYDIVATQPVNPLVSAQIYPANYYATIAYSLDEERQNSGSKEKLLDGIKIQFDNAKNTLMEDIENAFWSTTTSINSRNTILGLPTWIDDSNTVATINRSTAANSFWRSTKDATAYTIQNLKDSTSTSWMPSIMRKNWRKATHQHAPDMIITTKDSVNLYEDIAGATNLRFDNEVADLAFGGIRFGPKCTLVFDDYCPAGTMVMLSRQDWTLWVYPDANFTMRPEGWMATPNQLAKSTQILFSGQLRMDSPWHQARLTSVGLS